MRRTSLVVLALLASCRRTPPSAGSPDAAIPGLPPPVAPTPAQSIALDMLASSPRCRVEHRGAFVDVGTPDAAWSTPGNPDLAALPSFERDGATWGRILDRSQSFVVAIDRAGPALVSIRARARGAKKAVASVDGKVVGQLALPPNEDRVATVSNAALILSPGLHVVTLRWIGAAKKEEPLAELDWLRVGVADDDPSAYAAPTRRDAVMQVVIGGEPRKAYALMAPAVVRCVAVIPPGASFAADVGAIGEGSGGEIEIRERATGSDAAKVLATRAASAAAWSGLTVPLGVGGGLSIVEIAVTKSPKQGRVAIAEPRIVRASPPPSKPTPPRPDAAIVIVLAGTSPAQLSTPALQKLAREGTVFRGHRAPSLLATASFASLVTGLPVAVHTVEDPFARLSTRTPRIGRALAPFGIESAMFTEVPTTGPAFGFAHDWTNFAARSPLDGPPAAFDEIGQYLDGHVGKKVLVVAHARGAHPPWHVASEVLKSLPPESYAGVVDPRHAVAVLAKAKKGLVRLTDDDKVRLRALADAAVAEQDAKLDALIERLRESGALDRTLLIVTGDAPFALPAPGSTPDSAGAEPPVAEDPNAIPLVIRFPSGHAAGRVVHAVTDPTDVATTIVAAWGGATDGLAGRDLSQLAVDDEIARDTPQLSDDGHGYQLTWGDVRLVGRWGKTPLLEPRLGAEDLRAKRPHEYLAAWGLAAEARALWLTARSKGPGREPATIDPATQAALDSWERSR